MKSNISVIRDSETLMAANIIWNPSHNRLVPGCVRFC
jgi:hypothetical protein